MEGSKYLESQTIKLSDDTEAQNPAPQYEQNSGRLPKRSGTVLIASGRIITAVIGAGILSLPWATAGLGWPSSVILSIILCFVSIYTSSLLSQCYRSDCHTFMDAVELYLGGSKFKICLSVQFVKLVGAAVGYITAASKSTMAIKRSNFFYKCQGKGSCHFDSIPHVIGFGFVQMILFQIYGFQELWWLPILNGIMSSAYTFIGLSLSIGRVAGSGDFKGSVTGVTIGTVTQTEKIWRFLQAIGTFAFAYSHPIVLFEIQDKIKSPTSNTKTMQKATLISHIFITFLYNLCGSFGYAAIGDSTPSNLLTSFGFHGPIWLLGIANTAIVIHLSVAYQSYCQTVLAFIEKEVAEMFPNNDFVTREFEVRIPGFGPYKLNVFRLSGRTNFVIISTLISLLIPFFNTIVGLVGALVFWPLTVYFPVEMYISRKGIQKWSIKWIGLQLLSVSCLVISVTAAVGSVAGFVDELKSFEPFKNHC